MAGAVASVAAGGNVHPEPKQYTPGEDAGFVFNAGTRLMHDADDAPAREAATECASWLRPMVGLALPVVPRGEEDEATNAICFTVDGEVFQGGPESYEVSATEYQVDVLGGSRAGLWHGLRTLRQLLPVATNGAWRLPSCDVADAPSFGWRGVLLAGCVTNADEGMRLLADMGRSKLNLLACTVTGTDGEVIPDEVRAAARREGVALLVVRPGGGWPEPWGTATGTVRVVILPARGAGGTAPGMMGTNGAERVEVGVDYPRARPVRMRQEPAADARDVAESTGWVLVRASDHDGGPAVAAGLLLPAREAGELVPAADGGRLREFAQRAWTGR